jgi:hypothetical protein
MANYQAHGEIQFSSSGGSTFTLSIDALSWDGLDHLIYLM